MTGAALLRVVRAVAGAVLYGPDAPVPDEPPIPFALGQIRIIEQVGGDGRMVCFVRYEPVEFAIARTPHCRRLAASGVRSEPIADPAVQTTMVIRIIPAGTAGNWPAERGAAMTEEEAELAVRPDGSIETCRSLRRVDRVEPRPWADGVCASLERSSLRPFIAATAQTLRRGTIQVGYYVEMNEAAATAPDR